MEFVLIFYIFVVTFVANHVRKMIHQREPSRIAYLSYVFALVALAAGPLVWARQTADESSAMTMLLIGFAFLWFPILASRVYLHLPTR